MEKYAFNAVVFTADVKRHSVPGGIADLVIDFASLRVPKNPVVVDYNHDSDEPIGSALIKVDDDGIRAVGELVSTVEGDRAYSVAESAKSIPYGISPTVDLNVAERVAVGVGEEYFANGRKYIGPLTVFRNAVLNGISVVLYPTDAATSLTTFEKEGLTFMAKKDKTTAEAVEKVEEVVKVDDTTATGEAAVTVKSTELQEFVDAFGAELGVKYYQAGKTIDEARADAYFEIAKENTTLKERIAELEGKLAEKAAPVDVQKEEAKVEEVEKVEEKTEEKTDDTRFSALLETFESKLTKLSEDLERISTFRARGDALGLSGSVPEAVEEKKRNYRDAFRDALN